MRSKRAVGKETCMAAKFVMVVQRFAWVANWEEI